MRVAIIAEKKSGYVIFLQRLHLYHPHNFLRKAFHCLNDTTGTSSTFNQI